MQRIDSKIQSREAVCTGVAAWRKAGKRVGYTSGAFDLLHAGHVSYLEEARSRCDHLIVAVNSDASIQSYKSKDRPIVPEVDRATVVASLASVDCVFIFDEDNNNRNIELIKPSIYFKAGDYDESSLSSAPLVRAYGGDVQIIPFRPGRSTSAIINKIEAGVGVRASVSIPISQPEKMPAVFLDRDGTLIEHVQYLHEPEKVRFFPGGLAPLKRLQTAGYRLVMVTNQPGIGLGYFAKEDFYRVNLELFKEAAQTGVLFDKIYFSPYGKADGSECRKPGRALIDRAVAELNIDLPSSVVVGDTTTDMQLAKNIGCRGILVRTGYAGTDGIYETTGDIAVDSLEDAVSAILKETGDS